MRAQFAVTAADTNVSTRKLAISRISIDALSAVYVFAIINRTRTEGVEELRYLI